MLKRAVVTTCLMETIKRTETIVMPMLRVQCKLRKEYVVLKGWPEYVQTLPPLGSVIVNSNGVSEAVVENYRFLVDGTIELVLY